MANMNAIKKNRQMEESLCWYHGHLAREDAERILKQGSLYYQSV